MRRKHIFRAIGILLIVGVALFLLQSKKETPEGAAQKSNLPPGKNAPTPALKPRTTNTVAAPLANAALAASAGTVVSASIGPVDNEKERVAINGVIDDFVGYIQSRDLVGALKNDLNPEFTAKFTEAQMDHASQRHKAILAKAGSDAWIQKETGPLQELKTQTPKFNAAGDEATYRIHYASGDSLPMSFKKIDGKWYLNDEGLVWAWGPTKDD